MEWSKLKTIIILILAVSNVFLAGLLISRAAARDASQQAAIDRTVAVFEKNGIRMDSEIIPKVLTYKTLQLERNRNREQEIASVLGRSSYSDQGGGISIYSGENGTALFRGNGEFEILMNDGAIPVDPDSYKEYASELFARMGFDTKEGFSLSEEEDGTVAVSSGQTLDGSPVFNCRAIVSFLDGQLISVAGRRLTSDPVSSEEAESISVETALVRFLNYLNEQGDVCNRIETITPGYTAQATAVDPVRLVPVWKIVTDTGAYYVSCETGAVEKTE
ncbi:hypothetical protein [Papillibacter cinnamivorans]|uniref:Two-component signal transduction system YycFG, regulatory protein YycI n=1 Tax=Papillibacter cinnamivorans DSM 12816 TaxID=1122930 RepID=A0A1W2CNH2_9FIRM|nr:hypothetical protein [Papillibacter cinnamivorans]SMC86576.1 Two-component signal transduction system YycFG, regulatory protein YycI [Papillibacter cinnamivorans DSM 12816]